MILIIGIRFLSHWGDSVKKILVTGGAGFIGSHVVDWYIEAGHHVAVVDNLSTGKYENINPQATFYQVDIRSQEDLEKVFQGEKPEVVNHHAAQINLRRSVDEPYYDATINILGSIHLLELCRKYHVEKFIFASTGGAIYGEPEKIPVDESTPARPFSPYGVAKRSIELYLEYYHQVWGLENIVLRYGNVYGPRQDPWGEAGVIAIFCGKILTESPCIIFGDGHKTRDYVSVHDVAHANGLALSSPGGIFNLGTGQETSVLQLIHLLREITQKEILVLHEEERKGEIDRIALSSEKARRVMGWQPQMALREGMEEVYHWFQGGHEP